MLILTLMNIFKNFIQHKTKMFNCKYPEWMNSFIISSFKKRTNYTKRFYKNPSEYNKDLLNNQANECTRLIIQAKKTNKQTKQIAKMSAEFDNPNTAPKTYWSIRSRFLNKRKMPATPSIFADGKLISDLIKNLNFLIPILLPSVRQSKMQELYQSLNIELIKVYILLQSMKKKFP